MLLTLEEAATRLGKSTRQVRYLIQQEKLTARKAAGHWMIDSDDLPRSPGQEAALERKQQALRSVVDEALQLPPEKSVLRYSIRNLKAFQVAMPLHKLALDALGEVHPATRSLRHVLEQLTRGCHRFEREDKADAYRSARDEASLAVCELLLAGTPAADGLVHSIEQDLMAALAGLLRRTDRRKLR